MYKTKKIMLPNHFLHSLISLLLLPTCVLATHSSDLLLHTKLLHDHTTLISLLIQMEDAPELKCEAFMGGALKECRDKHVQCIDRSYQTEEEQKTARSIRRAALDPMSLEDQQKEDEKNIAPQDMSPLQRKINFADANDIPIIPFSTMKLGAKIHSKENVEEISNVRMDNLGSKVRKNKKAKQEASFRGVGSTRHAQDLPPSVRELKDRLLRENN